MNINELDNLRQLWTNSEPENLELAWQITVSLQALNYFEAEMLVILLFLEDNRFDKDIFYYFKLYYPHIEHIYKIKQVYCEEKISEFLEDSINKIYLDNINKLNLVIFANALLRFCQKGIYFVIKNNLADKVNQQLFAEAFKWAMCDNNKKYLFNYNYNLPIPAAFWQLQALNHLILLNNHNNFFVPIDIFKLKQLNQLTVSSFAVFSNEFKQQAQLPHLIINNNANINDNIYTNNSPKSLENLTNLLKLSFYEFYNADIQLFLPHINKVNSLEIETNYLKSLNVNNTCKENIHSLTLSVFKSYKLPEDIADLPNLSYFSLNNCPISYFPLNFKQLIHLETIVFNDLFKLKMFPNFIKYCNKLQNLMLVGCRLLSLPDFLAEKLINLQHFQLAFSNVEKLPANFYKLSKLKTIILNNNSFKKFPTQLYKIKSLKTIYFNNNFLLNYHGILPLPAHLTHLYLNNSFSNPDKATEFSTYLKENFVDDVNKISI